MWQIFAPTSTCGSSGKSASCKKTEQWEVSSSASLRSTRSVALAQGELRLLCSSFIFRTFNLCHNCHVPKVLKRIPKNPKESKRLSRTRRSLQLESPTRDNLSLASSSSSIWSRGSRPRCLSWWSIHFLGELWTNVELHLCSSYIICRIYTLFGIHIHEKS